MHQLKFYSRLAMFISSFILGWTLFPLVIDQIYHDQFFRDLQRLFFCSITPIFISALALYFGAEERIRCQKISNQSIHTTSPRTSRLQIIKYACLFFALISIFVLGWVFIPVILDQIFWEDYYGWLQFFMLIYSTPVIILSIAGYIITERCLRNK